MQQMNGKIQHICSSPLSKELPDRGFKSWSRLSKTKIIRQKSKKSADAEI